MRGGVKMQRQRQDNRVTVRIWSSNRSGGGKWHTSLQTHAGSSTGTGCYASIYTSVANKPQFNGVLAKDIADQGGEPDITCELYSLNITAINNRLDQLKRHHDGVVGYSVFGSFEYNFLRGESRNCCGLVVDLLRCGGIDNLIEYYSEKLGNTGQASGAIVGGTFFGSAAITGMLSVAAFTPPGIIAFLLVGTVAIATGVGVGGLSGKLVGTTIGELVDTSLFIKNITTPDGVAKLVSYAKEAEDHRSQESTGLLTRFNR